MTDPVLKSENGGKWISAQRRHGPGVGRRGFIRHTGPAFAGTALWPHWWAGDSTAALIARIECRILWNGRRSGRTWFHPRACLIPGKGGVPQVFMTLQEITGSDVYGTVHWTISTDLGRTWRKPLPIEAFVRGKIADGREEGVCDVVPQYHPHTGTILALGHNVYYRNGKLTSAAEGRYPVYAIGTPGGRWSERRKLIWDDARGTAIYTSGCSERVVLPDGDILTPLSFGPIGRTHRSVTSLLCSFDGRLLMVKRTGRELFNTVKRGLLEPSLVRHGSEFFMTIRAEDDHGYVTRSRNGLEWSEAYPWCFDDGEPLQMSTTQQHWLPHHAQLHLLYTRRTDENQNVMRWRAPVFVAAVDHSKLRLIRSTERVLFPLLGDPQQKPQEVARMGNFHPVAVTPNESWVTVGEENPANGWKGDVLLARIVWSRANEWSQP